MGQQPSRQRKNFLLHRKLSSFLATRSRRNPNPQQPIKFQYKTTKKQTTEPPSTSPDKFRIKPIGRLRAIRNCTEATDDGHLARRNATREEVKLPLRTKSEPNLGTERPKHRRKSRKIRGDPHDGKIQQFGYEIQDVDSFLAKATLHKPANIPVVLAFPTILYQTRIGGYQSEISLPLGMVVNAVFKNQNWLYVQTPHAEEGYVTYSACLPLGIIPPPDDDKSSPCWEKSTDVFPKPSGNMTDTEKLSCQSECGNEEEIYSDRDQYRSAFSACGEKSVDRLYLRATAIAKGKGTRHTLLVINDNYEGIGKSSIRVTKNEVVFLLNASIKGWFYVKNKEGQEGFIPSVIAGHGFL
ncbi:uncharacterized protein LOC143190751 [Rhynchophorus ferrugineus]|uniref:SH3 domain-containing protein n=1 Tax=Rhynchophorus ferrugineus TaxID=354439 RepID=A0A834J0M3_RHYFE|nr:hypothetical protein GWI33_000079 [Rhynchophorus ferrugineus]